MSLRKWLSGWSVWIDGAVHVGDAISFQPPEVSAETGESNQPGHAGPFRIPTGRVMALEATLSMGDQIPALEALVGSPGSADVPVLLIAQTTDGAVTRTVEYLLAGAWTKQERAELAGPEGGEGGGGAGGGGPATYTISARRLKHVIDGEVVREIDMERNVHVVGGVDVTEALRDRLSRPSSAASF